MEQDCHEYDRIGEDRECDSPDDGKGENQIGADDDENGDADIEMRRFSTQFLQDQEHAAQHHAENREGRAAGIGLAADYRDDEPE